MLNGRGIVQFAIVFAALQMADRPLSASSVPAEWQVCIYNFADLNQPTMAALNVEASSLLHGRRVSFQQGPCIGRPGEVIHLIVHSQGPAGEDALGRAALRRGRVLPVVQVFVEPLRGLIGEVDSSRLIGRALARVAAHEVTHFIEQDVNHDGSGLMRASFSGWDLLTEDTNHFRRLRATTH